MVCIITVFQGHGNQCDVFNDFELFEVIKNDICLSIAKSSHLQLMLFRF